MERLLRKYRSTRFLHTCVVPFGQGRDGDIPSGLPDFEDVTESEQEGGCGCGVAPAPGYESRDIWLIQTPQSADKNSWKSRVDLHHPRPGHVVTAMPNGWSRGSEVGTGSSVQDLISCLTSEHLIPPSVVHSFHFSHSYNVCYRIVAYDVMVGMLA
ncbi:hypothetical protein J6590_039380 [Homalodisca vitripennis]|nr:hypothetical protein J6590_039380 [Homalodisca vitripennis]